MSRLGLHLYRLPETREVNVRRLQLLAKCRHEISLRMSQNRSTMYYDWLRSDNSPLAGWNVGRAWYSCSARIRLQRRAASPLGRADGGGCGTRPPQQQQQQLATTNDVTETTSQEARTCTACQSTPRRHLYWSASPLFYLPSAGRRVVVF